MLGDISILLKINMEHRLPETNMAPARQESFPKGNSSSNPSVSGAMLVAGRVVMEVWFRSFSFLNV